MYRIAAKRALHDTVTLMEIEAPYIAKKAKPGQFIILRVDENGERVPLTVAGTDPARGTVTIIYQKVGYTTKRLDVLNEGDSILDFVGPLGVASHLGGMKKVAVIGGGLGVAIAYPQAKALHDMGAEVDVIIETDRGVIAVEVKAAGSAQTRDFKHLALLRDRLGDECIAGVVMHLGPAGRVGDRLWAMPVTSLWA